MNLMILSSRAQNKKSLVIRDETAAGTFLLTDSERNDPN